MRRTASDSKFSTKQWTTQKTRSLQYYEYSTSQNSVDFEIWLFRITLAEVQNQRKLINRKLKGPGALVQQRFPSAALPVVLSRGGKKPVLQQQISHASRATHVSNLFTQKWPIVHLVLRTICTQVLHTALPKRKAGTAEGKRASTLGTTPTGKVGQTAWRADFFSYGKPCM